MWVHVTPGDSPSEQHSSYRDLSFTAFDDSTKKSYEHMMFQGVNLMGTGNVAFRANWHQSTTYLHLYFIYK